MHIFSDNNRTQGRANVTCSQNDAITPNMLVHTTSINCCVTIALVTSGYGAGEIVRRGISCKTSGGSS